MSKIYCCHCHHINSPSFVHFIIVETNGNERLAHDAAMDTLYRQNMHLDYELVTIHERKEHDKER